MKHCKYCKHYIPEEAVVCSYCGSSQKEWARWLRFLGSSATIITAIFIGIQSCYIREQSRSINQQTDITARKFELENRPYFYVVPIPNVSLKPMNGEGQSLLAGVLVQYGNFGNYYARDIEVIGYKLYSDKQLEPYPVEGYWKTTYGGVQEYNNVPPKVRFDALDCRADMGSLKEDEKRYIQFSMRVKYKGIDNKEYGYGLDYIYVVDGGRVLRLYSKDFLGEDSKELPEIRYLIDSRVKREKKGDSAY